MLLCAASASRPARQPQPLPRRLTRFYLHVFCSWWSRWQQHADKSEDGSGDGPGPIDNSDLLSASNPPAAKHGLNESEPPLRLGASQAVRPSPDFLRCRPKKATNPCSARCFFVDNAPVFTRSLSDGVRAGLKENVDYVLVSEASWQQLEQRFGGGPAITRRITADPRSAAKRLCVIVYPMKIQVGAAAIGVCRVSGVAGCHS